MNATRRRSIVAAVHELIRRKYSHRDIAARVGVSHTFVNTVARTWLEHRPVPPADNLTEAVLKLLDRRWSYAKIAKRLGTTEWFVTAVARGRRTDPARRLTFCRATSRRRLDIALDSQARDIYCRCGSRLLYDTDPIIGRAVEWCPRCPVPQPRLVGDGL